MTAKTKNQQNAFLAFQSALFEEMKVLTKAKNTDYCGGDSTPFANFDASADFGVDPLIGLCIRMGDKFQRLKSFCKTGQIAVKSKGDTVDDIFKDLIGYSVLALAMLDAKRQEKGGAQ